jgi:uncharacterized protein
VVGVNRRTRSGVREPQAPWPEGETTWLPDVNVLLALLDPTHAHHAVAHAWFATARKS